MFLFTTLIALSIHVHAGDEFSDSVDRLKTLKIKGERTIAKARECLPQLKEDRIELCTGSSVASVKEWVAIELEGCFKEIKNRGYKAIYENENSSIPSGEFESFLNSSKRAETFHEFKIVAFKKKIANRIDCLHELIHVLQWTSDSKSELSPPVRQQHSDEIQKRLESAVAEIEKSEKANKVQEARARAAELTPYLEHLKQWTALSDWLDEKDAHFVIFSLCTQLNCTLTDLDVATANLYKRKAYLPKSFYPKLDKTASEVLKKLKENTGIEN